MTTETTSEIVPVTPAARVLASRTVMTLATLDDVARVASIAARSGLARCSKPEEAAIILMTGMELGLTPMQSLRGIYIVEGRPVLAADTMVAIVTRSGSCRYWRTIETTAERCEIHTQRVDDDTIYRRVWTMDDAKRAGLMGKGTWAKYPTAMLRHRCASDMAREIYPEILLGMYDPDEISTDGIDARPTTPRTRGDAPPPITIAQDATTPTTTAQEPPQRHGPTLDGLGIEAPAKTPAAPVEVPAQSNVPTLEPPAWRVALDTLFADAPRLVAYCNDVEALTLPGDAAPVWRSHRDAIGALSKETKGAAWKAIVARVESLGQKSAAAWLTKGVKTLDAQADAPAATEVMP